MMTRLPFALAVVAATALVSGCGKSTADAPPVRSAEGAAVQRNVGKVRDIERQAKEKANDADAATAPPAL